MLVNNLLFIMTLYNQIVDTFNAQSLEVAAGDCHSQDSKLKADIKTVVIQSLMIANYNSTPDSMGAKG